MTAFQPAVPLLRTHDKAVALAFYTGHLGCTLDRQHGFAPDLPLCAQVSRRAVTLHLIGRSGDATPRLQAGPVAQNHPGSSPRLINQDQGTERTVTDPFCNRLRFYEQSG